ncbi:MAG: S9 family peptidase [Chloroflexi bacterium]|nr:S9 family peptidase [Chloroflexota bacterium]
MPKPIAPDFVYKLTSVSEPSLSPDGSRLAFVRSRVYADTAEVRSQIMAMDLPDGSPVEFTAGPKDGRPTFSPDGQSIAFTRPDDADRAQVWLIPTSGGEARRLTSVVGGVTELAWSPDSSSLVFVSEVDPDRPPDDDEQPRVKVIRRIRYRDDGEGWRGDAFRHLFVVSVEDGDVRQLTDGEGDDGAPAWSPDGSRIAFVSDRGESRDVEDRSGAYVVPASGGEPELWSEGLSSVASVGWSPGADKLAVVASDQDTVSTNAQGWLFVLERGQRPSRLTDDSIKTAYYGTVITEPRWTVDGRILFLAEARGESYVYEVRPEGGGQRRLAGGGSRFGAATFDGEGRKLVVVADSPSSSSDLHLIDPASGSQRQLTDYNRGYFDEHPTAGSEKFTIVRGGLEIESRLYFPPDFDPTQKYPLVLDIHGGPHNVFYDGFYPVQQVLATAGYLVLAVNPRGSGTYGADFAKAVQRDWGGEDYLDILESVDEVCSRPYVDGSRLGLTGYSYGGFMSSWIVGHDHRFSAAVVGAPVTNLSTFYGTSDIGVRFGEVEVGGTRIDALATYREHSPLTYAANVQTPVLLLHGEADLRCPLEQSEQFFVALKRLGKVVEMVRFPGESHGMTTSGHPRMREEYLARMLAWFEKYIGPGVKAQARADAVPADG